MAAERAAEGRDAMQFGFLAIWKQISRYLVGHISDWKNKLGVASSQHKYDIWQALQFTCSAELLTFYSFYCNRTMFQISILSKNWQKNEDNQFWIEFWRQ